MLKCMLVDDEPLAMEGFRIECEKDDRIEVVGNFTNPKDALEFAMHNRVDFALLDIQMHGMTGIELAKELKVRYPSMITIFVTAYTNYFVEAYALKADYVVLKPYGYEDVIDVLERAHLLSARCTRNVFIRTFGQFDVFLDGMPIHFQSKKSKELLAVMVDAAGGTITAAATVAHLWPDRECDERALSHCRKVAFRLRQTLSEHDISDIIIEDHNSKKVNMNTFECDYYMFLQGVNDRRATFGGEYMVQYPAWTDATQQTLVTLQHERDLRK